tara:strand:- start:117 stop:1214 length:1098 start_codon:yes stop_codon:yes gene_type:complete
LNKSIFVHVGPPKTGTSAVQKWLSDNQSFLEHNGVFYPPHSVDVNGVSSGNVRNLYDVNDEKQLDLNIKRLDNLLMDFEASDCSVMLLSSEFFFRRMDELKAHFPSAKFIAYVRNPMEIKESSYNQSVKRHFQLAKINSGRSKRLPYMARLVEFTQKNGVKDLCLRLYGKEYFKNCNIVSDLLSVIGIEHEVTLPLVNSSYQFEALEFKRWFNQFELEQYQVMVDRALQGYNEGISDYSLIAPSDYLDDSIYYSTIIENYGKDLATDILAPLVSDMKSTSVKPYYSQELTEFGFLSVCGYLQKELKTDYYLLTKEVGRLTPIENLRFHELFSRSCDKRYEYLYSLLTLRSHFKKYVVSLKNALRR